MSFVLIHVFAVVYVSVCVTNPNEKRVLTPKRIAPKPMKPVSDTNQRPVSFSFRMLLHANTEPKKLLLNYARVNIPIELLCNNQIILL